MNLYMNSIQTQYQYIEMAQLPHAITTLASCMSHQYCCLNLQKIGAVTLTIGVLVSYDLCTSNLPLQFDLMHLGSTPSENGCIPTWTLGYEPADDLRNHSPASCWASPDVAAGARQVPPGALHLAQRRRKIHVNSRVFLATAMSLYQMLSRCHPKLCKKIHWEIKHWQKLLLICCKVRVFVAIPLPLFNAASQRTPVVIRKLPPTPLRSRCRLLVLHVSRSLWISESAEGVAQILWHPFKF